MWSVVLPGGTDPAAWTRLGRSSGGAVVDGICAAADTITTGIAATAMTDDRLWSSGVPSGP